MSWFSTNIIFCILFYLQGASIGSKVYPVQQSTIKNAFANDRPYSLRKRSRRLKLNKFSRVKICLNEECNYFKLLTRNSLIRKCSDQFISDTSNPELPVNLAGGPVHQFGFKERKVKRNSIRDNLIQLTDGNRFNVENYFSIEVQTTMPKNRKENHPRWKDQTEFEQSGNRHRTYPSDISHVNSFIKLGSSQVIGSHGGGVSKRDVVESRTDKMKTEDTEATSTPVKAEITKTGTVVCPTQDSGSGKKGNESRMPYDWDRDSYMALGSLTFLLLVLTCAVMYTGLWKKRNTMLYPDFIEHENTSARHKTDIKGTV